MTANKTSGGQQTSEELKSKLRCIVARHKDERSVKGTRLRLLHGISKMKHKKFHSSRGYLGNADDCDIGRMVKGCMKRYYKKIDSHREEHPVHTFTLDAVTFSHRSIEGRGLKSTTNRNMIRGMMHTTSVF